MSKPRFKVKECSPPMAWTPERKASKTCIRYFITRALRDKVWALRVTPAWRAKASTVALQMADKYATQSVLKLAREHLIYTRMRAFLPGAYGEPRRGDRVAARLWDRLN